MENLTQRFTILGQTSDEERAIVEASWDDDLELGLLKARSFIHSTLSSEYGLADEPSEPQLDFRHLQAKVAENEEALRFATTKVGTLQALLDIERQGYTSGPSMERELVRLRHSYGRLREIARDLSFNAARLLRTHSLDDPIPLTGFGVLCKTMADPLGHI